MLPITIFMKQSTVIDAAEFAKEVIGPYCFRRIAYSVNVSRFSIRLYINVKPTRIVTFIYSLVTLPKLHHSRLKCTNLHLNFRKKSQSAQPFKPLFLPLILHWVSTPWYHWNSCPTLRSFPREYINVRYTYIFSAFAVAFHFFRR